MKTSRLLIVTLAAAALLAGCDDAPAPAAAGSAPAKKPAAAAAGTPATVTPSGGAPYVYSYNPVGKRDPFRSPDDIKTAENSENAQCTEPLCAWDLDQLTLVAVVTGDANPLAMVEDPQGRGFIVRRNSKMGKQGGKVTNILRDSITVTEYFTTADGKVTANPVSIRLKADAVSMPTMDLQTGKMIQ